MDLTIGQHEWETIHTFEKMFDQLDNMTSCKLAYFEFLKKWPSMTVSQKSKHHREKVCHELNLWIKHRDPAYFDEHIKPFIKVSVMHKENGYEYLIVIVIVQIEQVLYGSLFGR